MKDNFFVSPSQLEDQHGRSFYLDNAKFFLIFFVVLAHASSPLKTSHSSMYALWYLLNSFHMPAFIFISGYLSRGYLKKTPTQQVQRVFTYMLLYGAAQLTVSVFEKLVLHHQFSYSIFYARSSLWFLVCLIFWYLFLPFLGRFRSSIILPASFLLALAVGYDSTVGNDLSFSRVIVHLPFFLMGYFATPRIFDFLKKKWVKIVSVGIIAGAYIYFLYAKSHGGSFVPSKIITCNFSYSSCLKAYPTMSWWCFRLLFYIAAILLTMSFLSLVPRCKICISHLGARTLAPYLLHRFLYLAYQDYGWAALFDSFAGVIILPLFIFAVTILLSTKPCYAVFRWLQSIRVDKLVASGERKEK